MHREKQVMAPKKRSVTKTVKVSGEKKGPTEPIPVPVMEETEIKLSEFEEDEAEASSLDESFEDTAESEDSESEGEEERDENENEVEAEVIDEEANDDSDDDDEQNEAKEISLSKEKEAEIRQRISTGKQTSKQSDKPGVIYIGRIPHGFYERQMRAYFSQFGDILRLRLSRNKKTGASKHFAFIEFLSSDVAEIVAETMNNYLLFGHILKVSVVPEGKLHPNTFVGANSQFKKIPRAKLAKKQHDRKRTTDEVEKLVGREQKRRKGKQEKLKSLGIDYTIPAPKLSSN
ncbi:uncharacterized protein V1516DRAFT_667414 [Lipomyces oligophaga]|uniref:uncharacterized protein n=1 Tax=Lipomyces oligophaga TaxID=45792 RepID=UPI0034CE592F